MIFTQWKYQADFQSDVVITPDGCRDILLVEATQSEPVIRLTDWDFQARKVRLEKGKKILGFRLCPGLFFDHNDLANLDPNENEIRNFVNHSALTSREAIEIVRELADYRASLQSVAKRAGTSTRTLQRHFNQLGLPNPTYWRSLSRARNAAIALRCSAPLTSIANTYGYSDQSHMTRDLGKWFGASPTKIRQDEQLLDDICQPGLGNWTFEQISMR